MSGLRFAAANNLTRTERDLDSLTQQHNEAEASLHTQITELTESQSLAENELKALKAQRNETEASLPLLNLSYNALSFLSLSLTLLLLGACAAPASQIRIFNLVVASFLMTSTSLGGAYPQLS